MINLEKYGCISLKQRMRHLVSFWNGKHLLKIKPVGKLKRLRIDNSFEYCNAEFDNYCAKIGIARKHTCTVTPQQNGVAERLNRTLMNKVRCMLNQSGMPKIFWKEAAATAYYVVNRSPYTFLDFKVPEQVWSGYPPSYEHLKPFGCLAYVHVSQGKLNHRAKKAFFLGYSSGVKGYKVWLIDEKKAIISRDIIFNENIFYKTNV